MLPVILHKMLATHLARATFSERRDGKPKGATFNYQAGKK